VKRLVVIFSLFFSFAVFFPAHAARLTYISDTVSDSRPSWPANHTIVFGVPSGVPASGKIVVAFGSGDFSIDPAFSYADVSLAISNTSPNSGFVSRSLAADPSDVDDGVAVASTTGPITITLASGSAIPAGSYVQIIFGTGGYQITNPSSTASYPVYFNTYDASGAALDYGGTVIVILPGVGVDVNQDKLNPATISDGLPTGTIPSNISAVVISVETDTYASCRYSTTPGVSYELMTNDFDDSSVGTFHAATIAGIMQGVTYNFYIRCRDFAGNENMTDYLLSFAAGPPTGTGLGGGTTPGVPAATPGQSGGGGGGGGGSPFPPAPAEPSLSISGIGVPSVPISVLQDGKALISNGTTDDTEGRFYISLPSLPQGTYSFTLIEGGGGSTALGSYTATITIVAGTANSISNLLLPPDISFVTSTVSLGGTAQLSGFAPPSSTVDIWITSQSALQNPIEASTSAGTDGSWSYSLATKGYQADTYQVKVRALLPSYTASAYSSISYLGVGVSPRPRGKGDLNGDGKVNLVDFSIMLVHWGQDYPPAEFSGDHIVGLQDLSILLYNWTG
jgi:hypothetical protein